MKLFSFSINGTEVPVPSEIQNVVKNSGDFGQNFLRRGIELVLVAIIIVSLFYILYGGIKYILSRGEKQMVQQAREQIVYAIIGLVIALAAIFIITFIGRLLNVPLLGF